ncbi:MAG: hypothetical protein WD638_12505 [Nitriliruptoraceae bacterium]
MTEPLKLLTVCLGNICRSPTAEAALAEAAAAAVDLAIEVSSAGTGAWHVGEPPDHRMRAAGAHHDLRIEGTAVQVTAPAMVEADLVLAMDRRNLAELQVLAETAGVTTPVVLFRRFDPATDDDTDVPDPYFGGPDGFDEVVAICRRTANSLVAALVSGGIEGALRYGRAPSEIDGT